MTPLVRYAVFAVLATLANLATQRLVLAANDTASGFVTAVMLGTVVGLVLKYVLDKRWVFNDQSSGAARQGKQFTLYTALGLVTTALFWATETLFWLVWQTDGMRELGAILGLAIGYTVKYHLDRRFVFTDTSLVRAT